jgi:hypothetical protein
MANRSRLNLSRLMEQWKGGDETAFGRLTGMVEDELRRAYLRPRPAEPRRMGRRRGVVGDAFRNLVAQRRLRSWDRAWFFAFAASVFGDDEIAELLGPPRESVQQDLLMAEKKLLMPWIAFNRTHGP